MPDDNQLSDGVAEFEVALNRLNRSFRWAGSDHLPTSSEYDFVGTNCDGVSRWHVSRDGAWVELTEVEKLEARLRGLVDQMQRWLNDARKLIGAPERT